VRKVGFDVMNTYISRDKFNNGKNYVDVMLARETDLKLGCAFFKKICGTIGIIYVLEKTHVDIIIVI